MKMAIGLTFPGNLQDESVICYLSKNFDISLNIIEASFSMSSGWAFLEVEGEKDEIKKSFEYIVGKGIKIQQLRQSK
ncbi:MAG: NIL domain-containing protein [Candidatus Omnitrophica bacterium]|nr:NIL domain-containing protein [Candidatus Omnitrophota bacterium]